jgi:hypothetical protein
MFQPKLTLTKIGIQLVPSEFLQNQIEMFHVFIFVCVFCTGRIQGGQIAHSYSEVVLLTTKHTMVYPGSGPSSEVIALCPVV